MTTRRAKGEHLVHRRTKILATVGPASHEPLVLEQLIHAGVNVFRLNLSHGDHADHRGAYENIRAVAAALDKPVGVLADLCGPKIRVGRFAGGHIQLVKGELVVVTTRPVLGEPGLIASQYAELSQDVKPNDRILLDDGMLELRVGTISGTEITCAVVNGGVLKDRKGMNLPGVPVSSPSLTDKDREDAHFALELGVDYLALSFVRRPSDVEDLRELVAAAGHDTPIIAKIEKPEAVDCIDEILDAADGVMVARGDLGVELEPEAVPIVQQELVARARFKNKPAIVATQMLESMIENPRPTRAEVADVSQAVLSGVDAVMLSAETSVGAYPVKAVEMMDRIARQMETWQFIDGGARALAEQEAARPALSLRVAVARSMTQLSRDLHIHALVVRSRGGVSASVVSATRPAATILALSPDERVCRRLNLLWGVVPCRIEEADFNRPQELARRLACAEGLAQAGETILLLEGFGKNEPMIRVLPV